MARRAHVDGPFFCYLPRYEVRPRPDRDRRPPLGRHGGHGRWAYQAADRTPTPAVQAVPAPGAAASADYLGSAACERCHEAEYGQWRTSLHVKMTKPVEQATILGDFSDGTRFADHGRSYVFGHRNGRPTITISHADAAPETFTVDYTLGSKRYQGYLSTMPDGQMYVLPVFWHVESRRWLDWKELTPIPDGAHDLRQIWNANCFNCHATNIVRGYDVEKRRYDTTWTEMGIGCEACHGPGRAHVALADAWDKDPATKPAYDDSDANRGLSDLLETLSTRSADPRRSFDTCAYCHGNKTNVFVGFRAGEAYTDYAVPFLPSDAIADNDPQGEFWPDGRPNRFNRPQALMLSGCFQKGAITCTSCHVAHGPSFEHGLKVDISDGARGDELCTQCHDAPKPREPRAPTAAEALPFGVVPALPVTAAPAFSGAGLQAHTFHRADSEGSRCINCHMSDVNWRLLIRRRDHTFKPPAPEVTSGYGVPNACTTCHDDRTPEWAAQQMDEWWGDGARRATELRTANALYRAGSGDASVLPELTSLALDRSQGAIIRASAADYISQILLGVNGQASAQSQTSVGAAPAATRRAGTPPEASPALVNTLIGTASDPEAIVRAAAVRALASTAQTERVLPVLTARLIDSSRIVRVRTAEALLALGIVTLDGAAGAALAHAQDEYADSLRAFPDVASNHAALGWLQIARGRTDAALSSLDDAIRVEPRYAQSYILKGIIAARAEQFDEAIDWWKKARSMAPDDPRPQALIAEAEKRKAGAK
ncbi:MAG: multiheme c-type cytochrome [Vicinamibacterales bacterium]